MPDYERMELVPESLLPEGVRFEPGGVPLLNAHDRSEAESVVGKVFNVRREGETLVADVEVSSAAEGIYTRIQEGHLDSLSVGYAVTKKRYVPNGETATISGRSYTGPVNVVTEWRLREVSLVPIPADDNAKFRGLDTNNMKGTPMSTANNNTNELESLRAELAELKREKLHRYIDDACERRGIGYAADEIKRTCTDEAMASKRMFEFMEKSQVDITPAIGRFEMGESSTDKLRGAMVDALTVRALQGGGLDANRHLPENQRHAGYRDFAGATLLRMAEFALQSAGVRTVGMSPSQIATAALVGHVERSGFHVSASFPNLLMDASNKTLLSAYAETPSAAMMVARIAPSAADFKNLHRIRMGELANLNIWPDNTKPELLTTKDEKVTYGVEAFANEVSFSWRSLVNDDLDAFSRIPSQLGSAASRTVNAAFWAVLIDNPTMPYDSQPLISDAAGNRFQDNTVAGALTVANVGVAKAAMRRMTGVNTRGGNESQAILNIAPRYLVVPATLETTAMQIVNSTHDPKDNSFGVFNPFRDLTVVVEPLLDDDSTAEWYLFAAQQNAPIEIVFLSGQETPVTDSWVDPQDKSLHYNIVQSFAICPVDHRGIIQASGS